MNIKNKRRNIKLLKTEIKPGNILQPNSRFNLPTPVKSWYEIRLPRSRLKFAPGRRPRAAPNKAKWGKPSASL